MNFADTQVTSQTVGLDQRGVPFTEGDNTPGIEFRQHDFLPWPNSTGAATARIKEALPLRRRSLFQCSYVVRNLEQSSAGLTRVDNLVELVADTAPRKALKPSAKLHNCGLINRKAHLRFRR